MAGEGKQGHLRNVEGKKAKLNPRHIQEYDFFVTVDGGESRETSDLDRPVRAKKKGGRNKNTTSFFRD